MDNREKQMVFEIQAIGYVRGGRADPIDDDWGSSQTMIELDATQVEADALLGLDAFSHAEIVFLFDRVTDEKIERGARHPRGREDWPMVGIFAQRGKNRPNRLGVTICRVLSVEGSRLHVEGLDAIDGTPVIDIKPVMREFLPRGGGSAAGMGLRAHGFILVILIGLTGDPASFVDTWFGSACDPKQTCRLLESSQSNLFPLKIRY